MFQDMTTGSDVERNFDVALPLWVINVLHASLCHVTLCLLRSPPPRYDRIQHTMDDPYQG